MSAFTAIGAARPEYDWRRYRVSSLAFGRQGWLQRANFVLVGVLYLCAAGGIRPSSRRKVGPRAVPALVAGAGLGLIGSGLFVTDPVGGFPSGTNAQEGSADCNAAEGTPTREGRLHNLSAIRIGTARARRRDHRQGNRTGDLTQDLERPTVTVASRLPHRHRPGDPPRPPNDLGNPRDDVLPTRRRSVSVSPSMPEGLYRSSCSQLR